MMTATYSPEDNKLRLYSIARLSRDLYDCVKAAGFKWAPKQELFVAPMWTPEREDLLIELCGEIGDEDTSLVDRAEERADRFEEYSDKRHQDAERAHAAVHAIADGIPLGQPILVGHHSERHARRDAEKIERGMRKAVKLWETSKYWESRAAGALRHAKFKELPAVRYRRIKAIEADKRKAQREHDQAAAFLKAFRAFPITWALAKRISNDGRLGFSRSFPLAEFPRNPPASQYEGPMCLWSALGDSPETAIVTPAQARLMACRSSVRIMRRARRWLRHYENRLTYERAMLGESGGIVADQTKPEKGGACRCWASPGYGKGWSYIKKVNKVSVTVEDNWGNGGKNFTRVIPFDNLKGIMTAAEVQAARAAGRLFETDVKTGFYLNEPAESRDEARQRVHSEAVAEKAAEAAPFAQMKESLRSGGVKVVSAPQLFPTPAALARQVVDLADIQPGMTVLEPSAGTGALVRAIPAGVRVVAVELVANLARALEYMAAEVRCGDFLAMNGELGTFDRIVMNPPFANAADIRHIEHARGKLNPGGRLVAIVANGPRQRERLAPIASEWIDLPAGSFKEQGTNVNAVIVVIEAEPADGIEK